MKTLYLDCGMGAAGDMLTASLLELTDDREKTLEELNSLGIPDVTFVLEPSVKCGVTGSHIRVLIGGEEEEPGEDGHDHSHWHAHGHSHEHVHDHEHEHEHEHEHHHDHEHEHEHHHDHDHEHHHDHDHEHEHHHDHDHDHEHGHSHSHNSVAGITHIVQDHINVSDKVKKDILAVYQLIAEAESAVHGSPVDQIHFHEVGTMDAVADVTAVCYLMDKIGADRVIASPVHVGRGTVRCAHGILPVPAPATALILKDIPIYSRNIIEGELCTPTGAALLRHFVSEFAEMPVMKVSRIGYGMGTKDFPIANCVRSMLGEEEGGREEITELSFNVDDMTAEEIGFAMDALLDAGAREVFTTAVGMKKNRPGTLITVVATPDKVQEMVRLIFLHTTTLGIRQTDDRRYTLERSISQIETPYGTVRRKDSSGYGVNKSKLEYDDIARISRETGKSIREITAELNTQKG